MAIVNNARAGQKPDERDDMRDEVAKDDVIARAERQARGEIGGARQRAERAEPLRNVDRQRERIGANVERAVARRLEAVAGIVIARKKSDAMAGALKIKRRVDHQALGAADAEVGMDEGDIEAAVSDFHLSTALSPARRARSIPRPSRASSPPQHFVSVGRAPARWRENL